MPKFIKLNILNPESKQYFFEECYMNIDKIVGFSYKGNTVIIDGKVFQSKETSKEILKLIAECEDN